MIVINQFLTKCLEKNDCQRDKFTKFAFKSFNNQTEMRVPDDLEFFDVADLMPYKVWHGLHTKRCQGRLNAMKKRKAE